MIPPESLLGRCDNVRILMSNFARFGLSWSPKEAGKILSGSNDAIVCLWDLNKTASMDHAKKVRYLNASRIFKGHEDVVEDVNWHSEQRYLFASVGDDKVSKTICISNFACNSVTLYEYYLVNGWFFGKMVYSRDLIYGIPEPQTQS